MLVGQDVSRRRRRQPHLIPSIHSSWAMLIALERLNGPPQPQFSADPHPGASIATTKGGKVDWFRLP